MGCQVDLSEGGSVGVDADAGISPGFSGSNLLNDFGPYADIDGNVSINLLPGTITNVGLGKKELKGRTGEIVVHDAHVKVDGCGGQVAIRFFATAMIDTDKSDDSVNAYGDILDAVSASSDTGIAAAAPSSLAGWVARAPASASPTPTARRLVISEQAPAARLPALVGIRQHRKLAADVRGLAAATEAPTPTATAVATAAATPSRHPS